jgi:hypothetical protein
MGILSALRKMFTSPYFLKPSDWLRAIPLLDEALRGSGSLPLDLSTLEYGEDLFKARRALHLVEEGLKKEVELARTLNEEEPWYPVKITKQQFALICDLLYLRPLSEGELAQVRAGGPQIAPPGDEADWRTQPVDILTNHDGTLLILPSEEPQDDNMLVVSSID